MSQGRGGVDRGSRGRAANGLIVCRPEQALVCSLRTGRDARVIGRLVVRKLGEYTVPARPPRLRRDCASAAELEAGGASVGPGRFR